MGLLGLFRGACELLIIIAVVEQKRDSSLTAAS